MASLTLQELCTLWASERFIALDFETTGLSCTVDRIVEIGALKFSKTGEGEHMSMLVDPGMPISLGASRANGISNAMVRGKKHCDEALEDLLAFLGKDIVIAHNAPFDLGFLKEGMKRIGKKRFTNKTVDTIKLCREAFPGRASYSLQNLLKAFRIDPGTAHRALDDARACKELFIRALSAKNDK